MATRLSAPVARRAALPLTAADAEALARLGPGTAERAALDRLLPVPTPADATESVVLHSLVELALARVLEEAEAEGYHQLAAERDDAEARRIARRRRPGWAGDR